MKPGTPRTYRIEHRFGRTVKYQTGRRGTDVANPHHDWMRLGPDGRTLYGAALWGGKDGQGGVFSFDTVNHNYRILRSFNGLTPTNPTGSPTDAGNPHSNAVPITVKSTRGVSTTSLVGMSAFGGANGSGSLYRMSLKWKNFRLLHSFTPASGAEPRGFVSQRRNIIFGMTRLGGITADKNMFPNHEAFHPYKNGNGVIFKLNLRTGKYSVLRAFSYAGPLAAPTLPNGGGYTIHHSFGAPNSVSDQSQPHGTLMPGPDGVLYGLGSAGGSAQVGGVFSINPKTSTYVNRYSFAGGNRGAFGIDNPVVTRRQDGRVVLYGMTKNGGKVESNFTPTPVANDWDPTEPTQANGTIWQLVLPKERH